MAHESWQHAQGSISKQLRRQRCYAVAPKPQELRHLNHIPLPKMSDLTPQSTDTGEVFSAASSIRSSPEKRNQIDDL